MAGGIILSNRLRAMQEAAANFGDSIGGIKEAQRLIARQGAQDKMALESHGANMRQAANQEALQGFNLRQAGQQEQDASALRSDRNELAAMDSGLQSFGPRLPADETPTPYTDQDRNLRARLMASIETKVTGKPVSRDEILTRKDQERQASDMAAFDYGEKKNKAGRDANKDTRDAAESAQTIKESKSREANNYAEAGKKKEEAKTGKPPSKEQFDAAGFGRRMEQATAVFDKLEAGGYDRSSVKSGAGSLLPNAAKSSEAQQQDQAERNFINSTLRRESGAAISPAEFKNAEVQYFPRTGDSEDVKAQKRQNRAQVLETMRASSGHAWEQVKSMAPKAVTVGKYSVEVED